MKIPEHEFYRGMLLVPSETLTVFHVLLGPYGDLLHTTPICATYGKAKATAKRWVREQMTASA